MMRAQQASSGGFEDARILVTGGTGTFGSCVVERLLDDHDPAEVRILSRGEHRQARLRSELADDRATFLVGDIRDPDRVRDACRQIDVVLHAAALKRLPTAEVNPVEAAKTNIEGAMNLVRAARAEGVDRVVALSTDKAVQPTSHYGATKLVAEGIMVEANHPTEQGATRFSVVRYGNVLGSAGSVVPLFFEQRKEGRLTITHEEMTRFFLTIDEAVDFVLGTVAEMRGGEIFVPRMPSIPVVDLAHVIAPDAETAVIGVRRGEKLHEMLLNAEEARRARGFQDRFVILPGADWFDDERYEQGKALPEGFEYTSDDPTERWSNEQIEAALSDLGYPVAEGASWEG